MTRGLQLCFCLCLFATVLHQSLVPSVGAEEKADEGVRSLMRQAGNMMKKKEWRKAEELLVKAMAMEPQSPDIGFAVAAARIKLGKRREALLVLESMLKRFPRDPRVKNNIAWILITATEPDLRDPDRALLLARDAVVDASDDPNLWGTLADVHYTLENYQLATRAAKIALFLEGKRKGKKVVEFIELVRRCVRSEERARMAGSREQK